MDNLDPNRDKVMDSGKNAFMLSEEIASKRYEICKPCDRNDFGFCLECSCDLFQKTVWSNTSCPLNKWGEETRDEGY